MPGYDPVRREVMVTAGETTQIEIPMAGAAPPAALSPPSHTALAVHDQPSNVDRGEGQPALKKATWAVLGAGLLGVGMGVYFALQVNDINKDLDQYRRKACPSATDPKAMCDYFTGKPKPSLTPSEVAARDGKVSDGKQMATFQYLSFGFGGALLIGGGYLFYRSYVQERSESHAHSTGNRFVLLPVIAPNSAGMTAALRF